MQSSFNDPEVKRSFAAAAALLMTGPQDQIKHRLGMALKIISANAETFDLNCPVNLSWIGKNFINYVAELNFENVDKNYERLVFIVYRFLREYDTSINSELSHELNSFINLVDNTFASMGPEARSQIEYARGPMAMAIIKNLINSDRYGPLNSVSSLAASITQKIEKWQADLGETEKKASKLGDVLTRQAQAFNFVGLHQGFNDLHEVIARELKVARIGLTLFGFLVLLPSLLDLYFVLSNKASIGSMDKYTLSVAAIGTVSLTLLCLYFFRISLRKADSCRAQLVQIQLRMSLCRFIENYAEFSSDIRSKNNDALNKFESLIFSGIVGAEDKLPTTFDGIEQLSNLVKSIRGK